MDAIEAGELSKEQLRALSRLVTALEPGDEEQFGVAACWSVAQDRLNDLFKVTEGAK